MNSDPLLWQLLLQVALIGLNAVFACAEIAVLSVNDIRLNKLAEEGDKRAARLAKLTSEPARFLATIQVSITLAGFLGSAFAADNFSERITAALEGAVPISPRTLDTICVIVITLILSYFTLVFGELVPKRLAMKHPEKLALKMSGVVMTISKLFRPVVILLTASTNGILRLLGVDPHAKEDAVTEDEIRMMIDAGAQEGGIDDTEKRMLQNVFEFDDVCAGEIATHRTQLTLLWTEDTDEVWEDTIKNTRHTRYPICKGSADEIIGILNARDYFRLNDRSRQSVMEGAVTDAYFVPASVKADALFSEMKRRKNQLAVVMDEFGGVVGIVTMDDLIEEIMGDLIDDDEAVIEKISETEWKMSGDVPLDTVAEETRATLPTEEYNTLGGLILSTQTTMPKDGTKFSVTVCGLSIDVISVQRHRIKEARVKVTGEDGASQEK